MIDQAKKANAAISEVTSTLLPKSSLANINLNSGELILLSSISTLVAVFCIFFISDVFGGPYSSPQRYFSQHSFAQYRQANIPSVNNGGDKSPISLNSFSPSNLAIQVSVFFSTVTLLSPGLIYFFFILPGFLQPWCNDYIKIHSRPGKTFFSLMARFIFSLFLQQFALTWTRRRGIFYSLKLRYFIMMPGNILLYLVLSMTIKPKFSPYDFILDSFPYVLAAIYLYSNESRSPLSINRLSRWKIIAINLFYGLIIIAIMTLFDHLWGSSDLYLYIRQLLSFFI